jgi:hypothetical protein
MSSNWLADKKRTDKLMPQVKRILGEYLISEAPFAEDAERNTDLIVLHLDTVRIAVRIRESAYIAKYGNEFTIRASRPSGAQTELAKVLAGWGDYLFYGFANPRYDDLLGYTLGNLAMFRAWYHFYKHEPGIYKCNYDNSSAFRAFNLADLPTTFVIARQVPP